MSTHTPGPWTAGDSRLIYDENAREVADANYGDDETERDANARLIAAAPDLLAALEAMLEPHDCRALGEDMGKPCPVGEKARAAIAKAKGET